MRADPVSVRERTAELVLHRPVTLTAGAARRIRVDLDDQRAASLHLGATSCVPATAGPHLLRVRCFPLSSVDLLVVLDPDETLRVVISVGALDDLRVEVVTAEERPRPDVRSRR